jgi:hypothetical protein
LVLHYGVLAPRAAYEAVRLSENPDAVLLDFLQSTYVAASLGQWDREALEPSTLIQGRFSTSNTPGSHGRRRPSGYRRGIETYDDGVVPVVLNWIFHRAYLSALAGSVDLLRESATTFIRVLMAAERMG